MAAAGERVFISYSRRDYYFAESLTLQLRQRGVAAWMDVLELQPGIHWQAALDAAIDDCAAFVLVASPAALASDAVRREWQRALAAGRRVLLLGWHRRVRLPAELQGCEWVDGRGRFGAALARLLRCLASPQAKAPPAGPHPGWLPKMPPAVWTVLLVLVAPVAGFLMVSLPDQTLKPEDVMPGLGHAGTVVLYSLMGAVLLWWLSFSLVQRRMGMNRLMFNLGLVSLPLGLAAWRALRHGAAGVAYMQGQIGQRVLEYLPWICALAALPLLTMAWIVIARPRGLLHWMPLGKAWDRMRNPGPDLAPSAATPAQALAAVRRYRLLHDPADAPMADGLRALLARQGAVEQADAAAQPVLLLSNRTDRQWLALHEAEAEHPSLLLLVGSAIGVPRTLDWVANRQWIDLRRGALPPGSTAALLPLLPEAVTQLRLPAAVARLHALLCALGVLLMMMGYLLVPADLRGREEADLQQFLAALLGGLLVWRAHRLLRRTQAQATLRRWLKGLLPAAVFYAGLLPGWHGLEPAAQTAAWISVLLVGGLGWLAWRALPGVHSWLPQDLPVPPKDRRLLPPRDWRTALVVLASMAFWQLPVHLFAPQLVP